MNGSFAIMTDSTSNLTRSFVRRQDIRILPLKYLARDREYSGESGGEMETLMQLYTYLRQGETITTSMANSEEAYELAKEVLEEGKDLLYIGLSSRLSGTFYGVERALGRLQREYPKRRILAVDSLCAALGEGLLVHRAVKMRSRGVDIQSVYDWCSKHRWKIHTLFTVGSLLHLKRSGRASTALAAVGTVLQIQVILGMSRGGVVRQEGKVRGRKRALEDMVRRALTKIDTPQTVFVSHGDCQKDACYVAQQLQTSPKVKKVVVNLLDPVIAIHTGPDSIGVFFLEGDF